ncbi:hypothetical protein [Bradyrhizobium diazoefficiens]|uniref:hypothetical protein n=1 Tax=Bradyrhizobium diazoefficiens TaxID=1355477 RepID=UPI00272C7275|nr:hypothetical protein [Bradyrhizobium diazoefficiens]WLA65575.1 hypothetical protein QNN01_01355 [Bradyrhizobium diazoefficiens]
MGWLKDILSPSNLWALFQLCFPAASAVVSGWLSYAWSLPPSVTILVAVMTAASVVILSQALQHWFDRRNAQLQRIAVLEEQLTPRIRIALDALEIPEGDFGHYTAYLPVRNTSKTEKLRDCRCEILELRDGGGALLMRNIGLRTRGQENKEIQGRFYLDQGAVKYIALFDIDQSQDDGLHIPNANNWDLRFEHGIYTAKVRCYGDSGEPDEVTLQINSHNCEYLVRDRTPDPIPRAGGVPQVAQPPEI